MPAVVFAVHFTPSHFAPNGLLGLAIPFIWSEVLGGEMGRAKWEDTKNQAQIGVEP